MIIFGVLQPVMFVVLFSYVFGGSIAVGGNTSPAAYREFLMAGYPIPRPGRCSTRSSRPSSGQC